MKRSKRQLGLFGAIAIGVIILLTLLAAPANKTLTSGSTYSRTPDGYGAWYAFMSERGTPVQRWQKPFEALANRQDVKHPVTLLRVNSTLTNELLSKAERDWLSKGNTMVILGVRRAVTEAPFSTTHQIEERTVKIDTRRRQKAVKEQLLGDRFGAIVWGSRFGKGKVIFATTPYLAANAYQDFQGNYEFLAQIVTQGNQLAWVDEYHHGYKDPDASVQADESRQGEQDPEASVWVDEYHHGYKDSDAIEREEGQTIFSYLAKTPLFPALVQGFILLLVAIWGGNRRFGKPLTLSAPVVDNSEAYIEALAGVLQKADSSELVLEVVGKEERLQLQKALFLGQVPLDDQSLLDAWVQQTGGSATQLQQLLLISSRKRQMSETELLTWLDNWEQIRRHLPSYRTDN